MMSSYSNYSTQRGPKSIDDLPDEVLEYIFRIIPPYQDLQNCALTCKRWHAAVQSVRWIARNNLHRALINFNIKWEEVPHVAEFVATISKRHSHSACCFENSMYVFGGCTSSCSTFNDLWRLDLGQRIWVRPLTKGTYPSPKACASLVLYKDTLVLFGGWSHPSPYPLHQAWRLFSELHCYTVSAERWTAITSLHVSPPPTAGHSATVHGDTMVVFGGLQKREDLDQFSRSNDVWCYQFGTGENSGWKLQAVNEMRPAPRYGQSQIKLNERYMMIAGGCGGTSVVYQDAWLLDMGSGDSDSLDSKATWTWIRLDVIGTQHAPPHLWCHPACKIGDLMVTFARSPDSSAPMLPYKSWKLNTQVWVEPSENELARPPAAKKSSGVDLNVNGRRGSLGPRKTVHLPPAASSSEESDPEAGPSHLPSIRNSAQPSVRPNSMRNRARQLEMLRRMEERIKGLQSPAAPPVPPTPPKQPYSAMSMFVLDIKEALTFNRVTWLSPTAACAGPRETILYSLVAGQGELIMFGGIEQDPISALNQDTHSSSNVSNSLRFITYPKGVV